MKLFHSPTSPYVRKVMVTAIEKGLDGQIEKMPSSASPNISPQSNTVIRLLIVGVSPRSMTAA